jgi:hypothetical protein
MSSNIPKQLAHVAYEPAAIAHILLPVMANRSGNISIAVSLGTNPMSKKHPKTSSAHGKKCGIKI